MDQLIVPISDFNELAFDAGDLTMPAAVAITATLTFSPLFIRFPVVPYFLSAGAIVSGVFTYNLADTRQKLKPFEVASREASMDIFADRLGKTVLQQCGDDFS